MLIGNYSVLNKSAGRWLGGAGESQNRSNFNTTSSRRAFWINGDIDRRSAMPNGYNESSAFALAPSSGGLSSTVDLINGTGGVTAGDLAGGLNAVGPLTGSGDITNAALALIVQAVAALSGSGDLAATINAEVAAVAALTGSGDVTAALLNALGFAVAALTGNGSLTSTETALGELSADIAVTGDILNSANVADAVWNAVATLYNDSGTMGELLHSAGSAGDPWVTVLPGAYTGSQAGKIVGDNLNAPITSVTSRLPAALSGGKMDSTLSSGERDSIATALLDLSNGVETSVNVRNVLRLLAAVLGGKSSGLDTLSPKFRNINDSKDVVDATITGAGNRTAVTLDLS